MRYQETLEYLFSQLPMFQRTGKAAYKANLDNSLWLDKYFGYPHKQFKSIHVAGTNGKGSVSHCLASVLQSAGYKVGLYTSPHLKDFRERIKINGAPIAKKEVVTFVANHRQVFENIHPSFFEMTVAMAFDYFAREKVDYAVIEAGLGGRLDSTNIISPQLSIITNISWDHVDLLGNSLKKIAEEKAGIIKPGVPVVVGVRQIETDEVFLSKAHELGSSLIFADEMFGIRTSGCKAEFQIMQVTKNHKVCYPNVKSDLLGHYQPANIVTTLCAVEYLRQQGVQINRNSLYDGIAKVVAQTGLAGRWQILQKTPLVICDIAHNKSGFREVLNQLKTIPFRRLLMVFGMVNDKNAENILSMMPREAKYYFTRASIPRAMDEKELLKKATGFGLQGKSYPSVSEAMKTALKDADTKDLVFIGGSTFVVAEVI